jgi:predicted TIM-barrel fold metal-dependent hydrolase
VRNGDSLDEYQIVSVDDHLLQPPDLWVKRVPSKFREDAPHVTRVDDHDVWVYGDTIHDSLGMADVVGKFSAQGWEVPDGGIDHDRSSETFHLLARYEDIRPSAYDPVARLADMDEGGLLAQLCFPEVFGFAGQRLSLHPDKELALVSIRAYNDFVLEEWCGAAPGRYIPMTVLPLWDGRLAAVEAERCAARGAKAVAFPENPYPLGLPSIHDQDRFWDPLFTVVQESGMPLAMHMGSSSTMPQMAPDAPVLVKHSLYFCNTSYSLVDWMMSDNFERFPGLKCFWAEGEIGWMPYVFQRLDWKWQVSGKWTGHPLPNPPSTYVRGHVFACFIHDPVGVTLRDAIGVDQIMLEVDFPHSDSTWPNSRQVAKAQLDHLSPEEIRKITRGNAERLFNFQPSAVGSR